MTNNTTIKFTEIITENQKNAMNAFIRLNVNGKADNAICFPANYELLEKDIESAMNIDRAVLLTVLSKHIELLADYDIFGKDAFTFFSAEYGKQKERKNAYNPVFPNDDKSIALSVTTYMNIHNTFLGSEKYTLNLPVLKAQDKSLIELMLNAESQKKEGAIWTNCKKAYKEIKDELQAMFDELNAFTGYRVFVKNAMVAKILDKYFTAYGKLDNDYTAITAHKTSGDRVMLQFILQVYVEAMQKIWNK